jgi:hypothetical protein
MANTRQARLLRPGKHLHDPRSLACNSRLTVEQKKFTCESTGHTGYTFFEAKESEVRSTPVLEKGSLIVITPQAEASKEINSILSDGLRSRVLDYVQFQNTSRMDDLGMLRDCVTMRSLLTVLSQ